jgi:type IV secretory pathway VirB4 component
MDIDYEDETDDFGAPTGRRSVDLKGKVADVLDLISVMLGEVPPECRNTVSAAILKSYTERGITTDPDSLYEDGSLFDEETGELIQQKKKRMPTLSDFRRNLGSLLDPQSVLYDKLSSIYDAMGVYVKGGLYDLFDRETSEDLQGFLNAIVLNFNVSQLEQGALRPLAMYVAMTWTWEKIVKKNPKIKKRIICDEAWMLVSKNIAGHEFTATFLENCARRIRKRNGGLLVASQNFSEFAESAQGRAVLTNTTLKIFLKQNSTDIDAVQEAFRLSDGEKGFLLSAKKGSMLIKLNDDDVIATALPSDFERDLISISKVVEPSKNT